jgi:choline dehydrogenase-like flavoprotein
VTARLAQGHDVIVVGGGSAGCVIAARLSEDPSCRVLLLEAGGSDRTVICRKPGMVSVIHTVPQVKKRFDWGFKTAPQHHALDRRLPYVRGKVMGGSSAINGMVYVRGNRRNYDDWAAGGATGWSYADVLPYFKKLEDWEGEAGDFRGKGGPIQVSRPTGYSPVVDPFRTAVAETCSVPINDDYNAASQEGISLMQLSCRHGVRSSTSEAYLQPALRRPNLTVLSGAHVHRVLFEGARAVGVRVEVGGAVQDVRAEREVILSAGAIGSPHLLLRSGVGPAAQLREHGVDVVADLPVGRNLHDHLFVPLTFVAPRGGHRGTPGHFFGGMIREFLFGGTWFGRSVFEAVGFLKTDPSQPVPNLQLHVLPWAYPSPNQDDDSRRPEVDMRPAITVQPTLLYPKSRGELRLRSADPREAPHIDPAYLTDPADAEVLLDGVERVRAIMAHPAMRAELVDELHPGPAYRAAEKLRAELKNRIATVYHPVGTCSIGPVVDPDLRVHGVDGLTVADASVFPSITGGNTNAPAIMVGEVCAAKRRAAWARG